MQFLYNTKVRFFILTAGRRDFGNELADPFGRSLAYLSSDWKRLLKRLQGRGLLPKHAACVASAWISGKTPPDRLGYPIETALKHVHDVLLFEITEQEGFRGYMSIDKAMSDEGMSLDED